MTGSLYTYDRDGAQRRAFLSAMRRPWASRDIWTQSRTTQLGGKTACDTVDLVVPTRPDYSSKEHPDSSNFPLVYGIREDRPSVAAVEATSPPPTRILTDVYPHETRALSGLNANLTYSEEGTSQASQQPLRGFDALVLAFMLIVYNHNGQESRMLIPPQRHDCNRKGRVMKKPPGERTSDNLPDRAQPFYGDGTTAGFFFANRGASRQWSKPSQSHFRWRSPNLSLMCQLFLSNAGRPLFELQQGLEVGLQSLNEKA
ncbi:hypothetical protein R3P38DRAFT_2795786 [Favolaschia claudopus]|uniref:Uncharacterized protein n=1 Tax=Favolaschia claudopus TaxID=2862362 RepID=A0AAW0A535_9AGAR